MWDTYMSARTQLSRVGYGKGTIIVVVPSPHWRPAACSVGVLTRALSWVRWGSQGLRDELGGR